MNASPDWYGSAHLLYWEEIRTDLMHNREGGLTDLRRSLVGRLAPYARVSDLRLMIASCGLRREE